ncbi:related to phospholipid-transporting ATPase DNF3 [Zygosaccharomyces bailii ISA1307]|uniref:Phospholipid-transporting ATPase n=1 Tax=Zygosaccharomyces bailii (strain CLIB 213 / ATCC 58445 / CBS 680 / BCRC 21525 / NBRC 1098 / NCYC 1416 / NRRL Y-2227) TaxID=1333698 RepID=A0A8J2T065_ZYGB2|nr:BN860_03884g1_1 [Zygosaccharomyces bailii CLIB 213]CDH15607.1 related to phospholipid-transporting ATPase DNF3 [Zygosaccharomyces bailii ISA1307]
MAENSVKRKRAASLRTQMFNKHMYDMFNGCNDQTIELTDVNEVESDEGDVWEDEEGEYEEESVNNRPNFFTRLMDALQNKQRILRSKNGRQIPVSLDHETKEYKHYTHKESNLLADERTDRPYVSNQISSCKYTVYTFLPRQLYYQFSKFANVYFFLISLLQVIYGWSTKIPYTMMIQLCVFIGFSMAREAYDDFKRHCLDKKENEKYAKVLTKSIKSNESNCKGVSREVPRSTEGNNTGIDACNKLDTRFTNFPLLFERHGVAVELRRWKDLAVGDFILLSQDDWVPADLLLLTTDGNEDRCFVETTSLNGELNLKSKQPHKKLNKLACAASGLANINAKITVEDPNIDLDSFEGNLLLDYDETDDAKKYSLNLENVLFRGSILRNTSNAVGVILFTGEETKIRMSANRNPMIKIPKLQRKLNLVVLFMVIVVIIMVIFSSLTHVVSEKRCFLESALWYLFQQEHTQPSKFMSFLLLYTNIIPSSLYFNMEAIKLVQSKLIEADFSMYDEKTNTSCEARTTSNTEELGQVSHIFSDKTGTLTENKLVLRKFSLCGTSWIHSTGFTRCEREIARPIPRTAIETNCFDIESTGIDINIVCTPKEQFLNKTRKPAEYKAISLNFDSQKPEVNRKKKSIGSTDHVSSKGLGSLKNSFDLIAYIQSHPNSIFAEKVRFFILCLALSHTSSSKKYNTSFDDNTAEYPSPNPDEVALLRAAKDLGFIMCNRNGKILTIKSFPNGFDGSPLNQEYEILETIEFSSDRKRMSVLVKMPNEQDKVLLICKGADDVILEKISDHKVMEQKLKEVTTATKRRKDEEAEVVIHQRRFLEEVLEDDEKPNIGYRLPTTYDESLALIALRRSQLRKKKTYGHSEDMAINSVDEFLDVIKCTQEKVDDIVLNNRIIMKKQQIEKYSRTNSADSLSNQPNAKYMGASGSKCFSDEELEMLNYIGNDELISNNEYVMEKTLQAIDEFSTEGLRTLLYGYKWIDISEYQEWAERYHAAKISSKDYETSAEEMIEEIEGKLELLGVAAIEDRLQEDVAGSIEKIRRAGIKIWMLTGDKRETAINVGYSCGLIHDYSTLIILTKNDEDIISKMNAVTQEMNCGNVAHCVVVVDGYTLALFEGNPILMSVFLELSIKASSVICCRTSPSQKSMIVTNVKNFNQNLVTLAIGDGANDVAMIQSADIGINIMAKDNFQASGSSDYSIARFRFLTILLFVHGRYNYIRTSKFVLCTFYKKVTFYMTQLLFQRYTIFSSLAMSRAWSLLMYCKIITLFPVLCIGIFERDLKPATLISVPELYSTGRLSKIFNLSIFCKWMLLGTVSSLLVFFLHAITWGDTFLSDNTFYTLWFLNLTTTVILTNIKFHLFGLFSYKWLAFGLVLISIFGWLLCCKLSPCVLQGDSAESAPPTLHWNIRQSKNFWYSMFLLAALGSIIGIISKTFKSIVCPAEVDIFRKLEQRNDTGKNVEYEASTKIKEGDMHDGKAKPPCTYNKRILFSQKED